MTLLPGGGVMRIVIAYESMFGLTRLVAEAVADGFGANADVDVVPVSRLRVEVLDGVDLFVLGAPTHMHGMPRANSRRIAADIANKPANAVTLEPEAQDSGVREWFDALHTTLPVRAAAFDTRLHGAPVMTGRASRIIARRLRQHGALVVAPPRSFLVTKDNRLDPGELDRAREWGHLLRRDTAAALTAARG
jgi:Flavodoxin